MRTVDEAQDYRNRGFTVAAERGGEIVEGFELGNSPRVYTEDRFRGEKIVLTTSNCTEAIHEAIEAKKLLIGSFLNKGALQKRLLEDERDVLLLCAGWKNKFNLEDSLFAGALVHELKSHFTVEDDSAMAAQRLYLLSKGNLRHFLKDSSHAQRLKHLGIGEDIKFSLQVDYTDVVPLFSDGEIRRHG